MPVVSPYDELRTQIEDAASRFDLPAVEKHARLRSFKTRLTDLLGVVDTYLGDNDLEREAERERVAEALMQVREDADIRDRLIARGLATAEELDAFGMLSHEALDELAEQGRLEEAAASYLEKLHPRNRRGQWIDKLGGESLKANLSQKGAPSEPLRGPKVRGGDAPKPKPKAASKRQRKEANLPPDEKARRYAERQQSLAGRVQTVASTRNRTMAEQHFNEAGKVSSRTLLGYIRDASSSPTTKERFSRTDKQGNTVWSAKRRALHEKIIDTYMRQRVFDPEADGGKGAWVLSPDAPPYEGTENPRVLFSGGGYAAGKGGVIKILTARGDAPESGYEGPPLKLDPDEIKAMLPEFQDRLESDPEANLQVYEEAWDIAQEIQARAQERKIPMIVDGISNTSPDEMEARVQSFLDHGYEARAVYVNIPTEEALARAAKRAREAKDASDRRHIPELIMRAVHRDVAATVPALAQGKLATDPSIPFDLEVWDNNQGKDENGNFRPPKQFFQVMGGKAEVTDEALWGAFKQKGFEEISGIEFPQEAPGATSEYRASVGATPFRPGDTPDFESPKFQEFLGKAREVAAKHNVTIDHEERVLGFWQGETEPSYDMEVHDGPDGVAKFMEEIRGAYDQDAVLEWVPGEGPHMQARLMGASGDAAVQALKDAGVEGARVFEDHVEVMGTADLVPKLQKVREALGLDGSAMEFLQGTMNLVSRPMAAAA